MPYVPRAGIPRLLKVNMTYTKKIIRHDCVLPDPTEAARQYECGTEWACDLCGKLYTLVEHEVGGTYYWSLNRLHEIYRRLYGYTGKEQ